LNTIPLSPELFDVPDDSPLRPSPLQSEKTLAQQYAQQYKIVKDTLEILRVQMKYRKRKNPKEFIPLDCLPT